MKNNVWFITGASQGLGFELTKELIDQGFKVAVTSRTPEKISKKIKSDNLLALKADVTNQEDMNNSLKLVNEKFGSIDILVTNASFTRLWTFEESEAEIIRKSMEINFFGSLNTVRAALPYLREQKYGHIFVTSANWGYAGFPYSTCFGATKFALDGWAESISHELRPLGITVSSLKNGGFRSDFFAKENLSGKSKFKEYKLNRDQWFDTLKGFDKKQDGDPIKYAKFLINLSKKDQLPLHIFPGRDSNHFAEVKIERLTADMEKIKKEATNLHVED
ncbi:SDR family oxidoreductase [Spiroplasma diminutum]|uniref:Short-chain dehydrogenase/reductase n=1 Tax=Spiroplasma diminutum CUAS-1 TaxID=1276221 RepID=S5MJT7_9MOLU|nr:SDR family oxidoreductase [Spiroplasma diminutum]AGR42215.1 short-chain dehydrogenase/reductase [Spiroplasma diminutum CUAS-1]